MVKEHLLQGVCKDTWTLVEDYVSVKVVVWCGVVEGVAEHSEQGMDNDSGTRTRPVYQSVQSSIVRSVQPNVVPYPGYIQLHNPFHPTLRTIHDSSRSTSARATSIVS